MKITENLTELVVELGELESFERAGLIIDCDGISVKKLLELFNETTNIRSREVVREIFDEVGYGWFVELDESALSSISALKNIKHGEAEISKECGAIQELEEGQLFSEAEFLDLSPISTYFH
jgi:hypothetical protein